MIFGVCAYASPDEKENENTVIKTCHNFNTHLTCHHQISIILMINFKFYKK